MIERCVRRYAQWERELQRIVANGSGSFGFSWVEGVPVESEADCIAAEARLGS